MSGEDAMTGAGAELAPLSLQDRAEIHELYAQYPFRWDGGDAEGWPLLFTPDCELRRPGYEPLRGREALRDLVHERQQGMPGTTHHTNNILLEPVAEGVRGRAYVIALRSTQEIPVRLRDVGTYEDLIVRHEGAWRFKRREFILGMPAYQQDAELCLRPKDPTMPGGVAADGLEARIAALEAQRDDDRERAAVLETLHASSRTVDLGQRAAWVDCFTADAAFELRSPLPDYPVARFTGRAQLAAMIADHTGPPEVHHKHLILMPDIRLEGAEASATAYFVHLADSDGAPLVQSYGRYLDRLLRDEGGRWRIAERIAEIEAWDGSKR